MKNKLIRYITGAGMIVLSFSLTTSTADATCSAMPSCSELGYTQTSCTTGYVSIKCPFDTTKMQCVPTSSSSSNASCSDLGYYTYPDCPDGVTSIPCPFDNTYHMCDCEAAGYRSQNCDNAGYAYYDCHPCQKSATQTLYLQEGCTNGYIALQGICTKASTFIYELLSGWVNQSNINAYIPNCNKGRIKTASGTTYSICDECAPLYAITQYPQTAQISSSQLNGCGLLDVNIGDYYYSDNTISSTYDSGKQLIGVIVDKNKGLVMSVDETTAKWSTTSDISIPSASTSNYDGLENTNIILDYAATSGKSFPAAKYCHDKADGGKSWFLPDNNNLNGFASSSSSNLTAINNALTAAGKTKFESSSCLFGMYEYWTSTFTSDSPNKVVRRCAKGQFSSNATKTETGKVRCMFKI